MSVLTAQGISRVALPLLVRALVLPRTVITVPATEFAGSNGDTITVRVRPPRTANTQSSPGAALTAAAQNEVGVDVSLSHIYDKYDLNDQEMDFDLESFASQITEPQVNAVAIGAEDKLASVMNGLTADSTIQFAAAASDADTIKVLLEMREFLGENDAPPSDRYLACSPDIVTRILSVEQFSRVDASGSSGVLRDAVIGRLFGFTVVESNGLDAGTAVAYHRSGFVFVSKVPTMPKGATSSAATSAQGIGLRQIFQYDPTVAKDQSLVSTYAGAAAVYEDTTGSDNQRFVSVGVAAT